MTYFELADHLRRFKLARHGRRIRTSGGLGDNLPIIALNCRNVHLIARQECSFRITKQLLYDAQCSVNVNLIKRDLQARKQFTPDDF